MNMIMNARTHTHTHTNTLTGLCEISTASLSVFAEHMGFSRKNNSQAHLTNRYEKRRARGDFPLVSTVHRLHLLHTPVRYFKCRRGTNALKLRSKAKQRWTNSWSYLYRVDFLFLISINISTNRANARSGNPFILCWNFVFMENADHDCLATSAFEKRRKWCSRRMVSSSRADKKSIRE